MPAMATEPRTPTAVIITGCCDGDQTPTPGRAPQPVLRAPTGASPTVGVDWSGTVNRSIPHGRAHLPPVRRHLPALLGAARPDDQARCPRAPAAARRAGAVARARGA